VKSEEDIRVGIAVNDRLLIPDGRERRRVIDHIADAGLDHLTVGDHISFHGGAGFDGLVAATAALAAHDSLRVLVGVYLAGLRHPMATARALSTLSEIAPGRLVLGVGVGGEDRSEISNAGVDPATRGRRLDETLGLLRRLADGKPVDHEGEFFTLNDARVLPVPEPSVPLVIGGAGDVAVRRTVNHGDGWLGMFCSARRYADTVRKIREAAEEAGQAMPPWLGLNMWCGIASDGESARSRLGERMQSLCNVPAEKFRNVTAAGTAEEVAERLSGYVEGGARHITLVMAGESVHDDIEAVAEARRLLRGGVA
jgi:alkanesulfonate monooxygenase SsuD/methylene tetrahydromethanopterin reductase-like flavin-dependent oxidoreductase (luciferase family)